MGMTRFFESLGAPLKNVRWSWGARRAKDGVIFLRAWKDEQHTDAEGRQWVMIANSGYASTHGFRERQAHIRQVESGARCLLVICEAEDPSASPRVVRTFDPNTLIEGRDIKVKDGQTWIRVIGYKRVSSLR